MGDDLSYNLIVCTAVPIIETTATPHFPNVQTLSPAWNSELQSDRMLAPSTCREKHDIRT